MTSIDLKKTYREHYRAKATPSVVDVPARPFLMIDGAGDPNTSPAYVDAIQALYPLAYGLRAAVKEATGDQLRTKLAGARPPCVLRQPSGDRHPPAVCTVSGEDAGLVAPCLNVDP